jgi:hypothetical protein
MTYGKWILPLTLIAAGPAAVGATSQGEKQIASVDLAGPFATRSHWRLIVTQGPEIDDPIYGEGKVPGPIRLCLTRDNGRSCTADFHEPLRVAPGEDLFADAHVLRDADIVHPQGARGRALLLVRSASLQSANGDAREGTQLLAYDREQDRFVTAFAKVTGRNNNQEIRYVDTGPLRGAVIVAEPTGNAPFGFWITVNRLTPAFTYKQALHFRSATHYGDGNPLAVIDSEMPTIQRRLGLWRTGEPLPAPKGCAKPRLVKMALWCS